MALHGPHGQYLIHPVLPLATRKGKPIPNQQRMELGPERMAGARDIVVSEHASAYARSLRSVYNCMGMVFASRRTFVDIDQLDMVLDDDDYRPITEGDLERGDLVIYRDASGIATHVGLVVNVSPMAKLEITVLSQWGSDGEYFHRADDVNPRFGTPTEYRTDRT